MTHRLTAARVLAAYAQGVFPMAESATAGQLYWFDPAERGILPIGAVHVSRSLRRFLAQSDWQIKLNQNFAAVVDGCADRPETWINAELTQLYSELFDAGHAHSIEVYDQDQLIGGMFGLSLGGAFFAESMFSRRSQASKTALVWMSAHLRQCGFTIWDTQYPNPHLQSLGGQTISRADYRARLHLALAQSADLNRFPLPSRQALLHEITQTS